MKISELTDERAEELMRRIENVLETTGFRVENEELREKCRLAGAPVDKDTDIVRFPAPLLRHLLSTIPRSYKICSAFGQSWEIGGGERYICGIVIDPWIVGSDGKPRRPSLKDLTDNLALMEYYGDVAMVSRMDFPVTDFEGQISSTKALEQYFLNFGKHYGAYCTSLEQLREYFEIGRILLRGGELRGSRLFTVAVGTLSPLALTDLNARLLLEACRYDMPVIPTTCPMAGSTSPYSLAGTFLQGLCEVIALGALTQIVNPGNPYLFSFGPSVAHLADMHDMYYTMDKNIWKTATIELARRYGLPCIVECGGTMSPRLDMQSGAEAMLNMLTAVASGADVIAGIGSCYNAVGLSSEHIVMGAAFKHAAEFMCRGMRMETLDEAAESLNTQGPGGNFLTDDLTIELMHSDEFFSDPLFDYMGEFRTSTSMYERAHNLVFKVAAGFKSPVPEDTQAEIRHYFSEIYRKYENISEITSR